MTTTVELSDARLCTDGATPTGPEIVLGPFNVSGAGAIRITALLKRNGGTGTNPLLIDIEWLIPGCGVDIVYTDHLDATIGEEPITGTFSVRTSLVRYRLQRASSQAFEAVNKLYLQSFLLYDSSAAHSLSNLGAGAQIYKSGAHGIRSVISSDASITISQLADEINLQGASGGVETIVAGDGISVDATDPANPIVSTAVFPQGAFGEIVFTGTPAAPYVIATNDVDALVAPTTTLGPSAYLFDQSAVGVLRYTGASDKIVCVTTNIDIQPTDATYYLTFTLYKNGSGGTALDSRNTFLLGGYEHITLSALVSASQNDTFSVYAKNSDVTPSVINTNAIKFHLNGLAQAIDRTQSVFTGTYEGRATWDAPANQIKSVTPISSISTHPDWTIRAVDPTYIDCNVTGTYTFNCSSISSPGDTFKIAIYVNELNVAVGVSYVVNPTLSHTQVINAGDNVRVKGLSSISNQDGRTLDVTMQIIS